MEAMETGQNAEESSSLSEKVHSEQTTGSVRLYFLLKVSPSQFFSGPFEHL